MLFDSILYVTHLRLEVMVSYPISDFRTEATSVGARVCFCDKMPIRQG